MESVSLIDLVVDYEVPPTLIIEAICGRRLRPIVRQSDALSLDDIAFDRAEAESVFWTYSLKVKSVEAKATLARQFARYDAIRTGIISAVAASGITAVAVEVFDALTAARPGGPAITSGASKLSQAATDDSKNTAPHRRLGYASGSRPKFSEPFDPLKATAKVYYREPGAMLVESNNERDDLILLAAADGQVWNYGLEAVSRPFTWMFHGEDWRTRYFLGNGKLNTLVEHQQMVTAGVPIIRISPLPGARASATFEIFRRVPGEDFETIPAAFVMHAPGRAPES